MSDDNTIHASKKIGAALNKAKNGLCSVVSLQGGSRSGKTYTTILFLITEAIQRENCVISIVRATLPALRGSALVDFVDIMHRLRLWNDQRFNKTELCYMFANGSKIEFFSCDDEQKLRGRKRDILFCNEANELTAIMWQQLKMRTGLYAVIDYNPSFSPEHWINEINADTSTEHVITTYKDNEKHLPAAIIQEIESLQQKNPNLWQIYGLGQIATIEGVVFPNFEQVDDMPGAERQYIGVDFGFSNDFTAIIEVQFAGDNLFINEIEYKTHLLTNEIISILKQYPRHEIICESADPRLLTEIQNAGIAATAVKKFPGSIEAGITKMQTMNLHVTKRSLNVIKELRNYCYKKNPGGQLTNIPIDAFNHALDAIRYVVLMKATPPRRYGITKAIAF